MAHAVRHTTTQPAARPLVALLIGLAFSACGPDVKYPSCETDADCKSNAEGSPIEEYCVNQRCQECRDDTNCDTGYECKSGRCDQKSECPCTEPLVCQNKKCVQPECVNNEDCGEGKKCEANACVSAGCTSDQECGAGMVCSEGVCAAAPTDKISSSCRPMDGSSDVVALQTVNFDFDQADLTVEARKSLDQNAECLNQAPAVSVVLEGHCDERGTQEYNLALGERRAQSVESYLSNLGVETNRMRTVSKGKNQPLCEQSTDSCFSKNRRVMFLQKR